MASFSPLLCLLGLGLFVAGVQACNTPNLNECGCIKRPTFEQNWLEAKYPALAEEYEAYTFSAPEVTYPNCSACVAKCSVGSIANLDFASGKLTIGTKRFPNPTILDDLVCDDHVWYNAGLVSEMDSNFNSSSLSCAVQN